jgi:hypothetical protein
LQDTYSTSQTDGSSLKYVKQKQLFNIGDVVGVGEGEGMTSHCPLSVD